MRRVLAGVHQTNGQRFNPGVFQRRELRADGGSTQLVLSCTSPVPPEHRASVRAGWHFHLDALATALAGGETDLADPTPAWAPLHERYAASV